MSPSAQETSSANADFFVGIGASAGGFEALRPLIERLRPTGRVAYIVVQHVPADHPSSLAELLARNARLAVRVAIDGEPVIPDQVLVAPPGWNIAVRDDRVQLIAPLADARVAPSIDRLLVSLAESRGDRAVGVLLSGTGRDGVAGGRAIREAGGRVIVQRPANARYADLPEAAIQAGVANRQMDVEDIADSLKALADPPPVPADPPPGATDADAAAFQELLQLVLAATQMDATHYKRLVHK